jgi:hypothetical protein
MAEPTQYSFNFRDVAAALAREQGIRAGRWMLGFEFSMTAGNFGPSPSDAKPAALIQINSITLVSANDAPADSPLVIDASKAGSLETKRPRRSKKAQSDGQP